MSGILELLDSVDESDLESVKEKVAGLRKELSGLQELQKILEKRLGVERPKRQRGGASKSSAAAESREDSLISQRRRRIYEHITANGPKKPAELCAELDIPNGSITATINHCWFERTPDGIAIA